MKSEKRMGSMDCVAIMVDMEQRLDYNHISAFPEPNHSRLETNGLNG